MKRTFAALALASLLLAGCASTGGDDAAAETGALRRPTAPESTAPAERDATAEGIAWILEDARGER